MTVRVVYTSVFVATLLGPGGASRKVLRRCLKRSYEALMGSALINESEAVLSRRALFEKCVLPQGNGKSFRTTSCNVCRWTRIYYMWRPNLPDEADNHVVEVVVAGDA